MELLELCKYDPGRGLDYYVAGLAGILRGARRGASSTHAYTKEVRKALETLVFGVWSDPWEFIDAIVEANIPRDLQKTECRKCFAELLKALLRKFREKADSLPAGARIRLMNMIVSAIAEMARYSLPPAGDKIFELCFLSNKNLGGEKP
ncbi:MAG: hypothetical protein F7C37_04715 [Desulfurococcales archaeon]|nr:hypothetical protein [Desulfurococcales archaeon]